jgi:8-oxo-dGTP pyrophosphatase MutT (NUDIX family)
MISAAKLQSLEKKLQGQVPLPKNMAAKIMGDVDLSGGAWEGDEITMRKAAVLVALIARAEGITILLTKRTAHLPTHAGQISLPGGKVEESDEDIVFTALREAEEEVGLDKSFVNVLGVLEQYKTGTGFDISPVIGMVGEGFEITIDQAEVADVFEIPLSFVLNKQNHILKTMYYKGADRHFYAMEYEGHNIWGATAAILVNFYHVLMQYVDEDN